MTHAVTRPSLICGRTIRLIVRSHPAPLTAAASSWDFGTYRVAAASARRRPGESSEVGQHEHGVGPVEAPRDARPIPQSDQTHADEGARHCEHHEKGRRRGDPRGALARARA